MTETIALELTLSRWHKVAERLASKASECSVLASAAFCSQRVNGYAGSEQKAALQAKAAAGESALNEHLTLLEALSVIRSSLAKANAEIGVSRLLAEQETSNRRLKALREILAGQKTDMVSIDSLESYKPYADPQSRYGYRDEAQGAIAVRCLSCELESKLQSEAEKLQSALHRIADEASDANSRKIKIEISVEAARIAGMA